MDQHNRWIEFLSALFMVLMVGGAGVFVGYLIWGYK